MTSRTLEEIATDMALNAHARTGDAEKLHPKADELLIETIEVFAANSPYPEARDMAARIVESWRETPRWYS